MIHVTANLDGMRMDDKGGWELKVPASWLVGHPVHIDDEGRSCDGIVRYVHSGDVNVQLVIELDMETMEP